MKARKGLVVGCVSSMMLAGLSGLGCGSSRPPRELLDARAAYKHAQAGPASQLTPATLHEAKVSLDRAERAYDDDADAPATRDMAYVAQRKAQLAEAEANAAAAKQQAQIAVERARLAQAQQTESTETQLAEARAQLATTSQELEKERAAREEAEKKSQEALDKLSATNANMIRKDARGTIITLPGQLLFATGKSDLMPGAKKKLDTIIDALKAQQDKVIVVEGHTDAQGSDSMNLDLSQRRAESVRQYLISKDVPENQLKAVGRGEADPIASNDNAGGRQANRRVEIVVENSDQQQQQQP